MLRFRPILDVWRLPTGWLEVQGLEVGWKLAGGRLEVGWKSESGVGWRLAGGRMEVVCFSTGEKECVSLGGVLAGYVASVGRNNPGPGPGADSLEVGQPSHAS